MNDFSKKELAGSLAIPILTLLYGLIFTVNCLSWSADFWVKCIYGFAYPLAIILGGALPIFLTLKYKIHTEDYLKKRLIFIIPVFIIYTLLGSSFLAIMWKFFLYILLGIGSIIFEIFMIQDESTTGGERTVLMLSDPIIYWTLDNLISCFTEIVDLGPLLEYYGWF